MKHNVFEVFGAHFWISQELLTCVVGASIVKGFILSAGLHLTKNRIVDKVNGA